MLRLENLIARHIIPFQFLHKLVKGFVSVPTLLAMSMSKENDLQAASLSTPRYTSKSILCSQLLQAKMKSRGKPPVADLR